MPAIPDGQPLLLRYNTPDDTSLYYEVEADIDGNFNLSAGVQMYDCIILLKGATAVGHTLVLSGTANDWLATGRASGSNTEANFRVTEMGSFESPWIFHDDTISGIEYYVNWVLS